MILGDRAVFDRDPDSAFIVGSNHVPGVIVLDLRQHGVFIHDQAGRCPPDADHGLANACLLKRNPQRGEALIFPMNAVTRS